ncbi:hypothetical protein GF395_03610 [Candidatus Uhrbacteria bacterium]|nr:hypothetical protein [Candidatus Uhrbacteria bacterium]
MSARVTAPQRQQILLGISMILVLQYCISMQQAGEPDPKPTTGRCIAGNPQDDVIIPRWKGYSTPSVMARRRSVQEWHDAFLEALELELMRFLVESRERNAVLLWEALRYQGDPQKSFQKVRRLFPLMVDGLESRLRQLSPKGVVRPYSLYSGPNGTLSTAGLLTWERMRARLVRGRSPLGSVLARWFA